MKGFFNKILHINLSQQRYWVEPISDKVLASWLGGRGLGCYLLWHHLKPGVDPLSAENVLIFAVGPATGTKMVLSSRYGVYTKSPLTNFFADSYAGGSVAPIIKGCGYDALIIEGAAPSPIFLEISPQGVNFHDAAELWGKDTYEAEERCHQLVGVPGAQTVVIGPAGENLVRFACIVNNRWRCAGRAGAGAVMGAKKLKAILFHGDITCPIADPQQLESLIKELVTQGKTSPGARAYREFGTPYIVGLTNPARAFPAEYWTKGTLEGWEELSAQSLLNKFKVRAKACPRCFFACGKLTTITDGKHKGLTIEGPEYETIYSFGGLCKIVDLAEIAYLNDLCDRMGMDTITAGNLIAFCMELSKRGRLSPKVDYGDADKAAELLLQICHRQGLGGLLADGIITASRALNAEELAIHVKGLEPAGYDPRILAITDLELDKPKLKEIANNIATLRRLINLRQGLKPEDDLLPPRLFNEPRDDGAVVNKEEFMFMLKEYYRLRGWDNQGKPINIPPLIT